MDTEVIDDYTNSMKAGASFPPVVVFNVGEDYFLADGYHRFMAVQGAGFNKILADVRIGTMRDAILCSVGVNSTHGLQRTNEDKRRAVLTLLRDKEWSVWSNGQIAKSCNVSDVFVGKIRLEILTEKNDVSVGISKRLQIPSKKVTVERAGKVFKMDTSRIGKSPKPAPEPAKELDSEIVPPITESNISRKERYGGQEQPQQDPEDIPINRQTVPDKTPLDPVPPPCSQGIPCPTKEFQQKDEKGRTSICKAAGAEVRQLDECPHDKKKRKEAMAAASGFTPASDYDPITGGKFIRGPPLKITKPMSTPDEVVEHTRQFVDDLPDQSQRDIATLLKADREGQFGGDARELIITLLSDKVELGGQ